MKKRALSLLMAVLMVVGLLPATARAVETENTTPTTTVNVDFTAQMAGYFLIPPKFNVAVSSNEAENFGYKDKVANGVSALDVLVKAHEIKYGNAFTRDTKGEYLVVPDSGFVSKLFRIETSANGFTLNGAYPNDGTKSQYGGYNGTTVTTQAVVDNDSLEFFIDQDDTGYSDNLAWFCQGGVFTDTIVAKPAATVDLLLKSTSYMGGYLYRNAEEMHAVGSIVKGAQLAWVNTDTGEVKDIKDAVTDVDGKVTLTMPKDEGTSYLTAYKNSESNPLVMSLTKVVADTNATEADPCALTSLVIENMGSASLKLTPAFNSDVTEYRASAAAFPETLNFLFVTVATADENATVKADLNGTKKDLVFGSKNNFFNVMVPGQDNILTITVTNGEQSKTYTVTIPMAADPAAPKLKGNASVSASVAENTAYTLDLTTVFEAGTAAIDSYKVSVDGAAAESVADGTYTNTWAKSGTHTLVFTAYSGSKASPTYTVNLKVTTSAQLVMDNIAAKYAKSGVAGQGEAPWLAADMMAYAKTFPETANQLSAEHKQAMVDEAIGKLETPQKPGDVAKYIIAMVAMGYDPANLTTSSGEPLDAAAKLAALVNEAEPVEQPAFGDVYQYYTSPYVMIALQQFGDTYQSELNKLVTYAVEHKGDWQSTDWGVAGITFMVPALAPYYNTNGAVKTALDKGIENLVKNQNENGTIGDEYSTGLSAVAFAAVGKNPAAVKNVVTGKSLVDGLMTYVNSDQNGFTTDMATEQCFRGLIALANAKEGQSYRLYDFSGQTLVPAVATFWAQNAAVSVKTIPEDAAVVVKSGEAEVAADKVHGAYDLPAGAYTYTVSKDGYVTKTGSFTITAEQAAGHEKQTIHVSLVSAGSGSGSSSKDIEVTVKVMVPPEDKSKLYTYKHDSRSYTNLLTTTGKVTVTSGSSVRDAFVTALDRDNIGYTEQHNGYFPMIGDWSEFERGEKSGWMYLVNGSMPSVAAQDYELTGSATVVWFYTDDYSNDYRSESWDDNSSSSSSGTTATPTTPVNPVPDKAMSFTDVKSDDWYYSSVRYAYDNGLFSGVSHESFGPGDSMDRSMLATVLYSLDGKPAAGKSGFADVADGAWYADAVAWAAEHGIVSGVGGGAFTPGGTITREQLAVMLYRYAQYKGYDVSKTADLSGYADQDKLSDWAAQAVQWACGSGLMTGRSAAQLAPEGTLTRAEAATMLKAFCENVKK